MLGCRQALECIGIIAYAFVLFRSITPQFEAGAKEPGTFKQMIVLCFRCMAPGMALMFFTHFLVLHAVQNMFAELTRFADRKFYEGTGDDDDVESGLLRLRCLT